MTQLQWLDLHPKKEKFSELPASGAAAGGGAGGAAAAPRASGWRRAAQLKLHPCIFF
jgi:hypothetical protein